MGGAWQNTFNVHSCYLLLMYICICQLYIVHICEKQLLKLFMNLLKYYTFTGFVYLALKNFADIALPDKHHLLCPLP